MRHFGLTTLWGYGITASGRATKARKEFRTHGNSSSRTGTSGQSQPSRPPPRASIAQAAVKQVSARSRGEKTERAGIRDVAAKIPSRKIVLPDEAPEPGQDACEFNGGHHV